MELIKLLCRRFRIHPMQVFKLALDLKETRAKPRRFVNYYLKFCKVRSGEPILHRIPTFVEDYCLDVLAKRVTIPRKVLLKCQQETGRFLGAGKS